ncbi:unnamed protein product, partial [Amoebophrya sp. A120]
LKVFPLQKVRVCLCVVQQHYLKYFACLRFASAREDRMWSRSLRMLPIALLLQGTSTAATGSCTASETIQSEVGGYVNQVMAEMVQRGAMSVDAAISMAGKVKNDTRDGLLTTPQTAMPSPLPYKDVAFTAADVLQELNTHYQPSDWRCTKQASLFASGARLVVPQLVLEDYLGSQLLPSADFSYLREPEMWTRTVVAECMIREVFSADTIAEAKQNALYLNSELLTMTREQWLVWEAVSASTPFDASALTEDLFEHKIRMYQAKYGPAFEQMTYKSAIITVAFRQAHARSIGLDTSTDSEMLYQNVKWASDVMATYGGNAPAHLRNIQVGRLVETLSRASAFTASADRRSVSLYNQANGISSLKGYETYYAALNSFFIVKFADFLFKTVFAASCPHYQDWISTKYHITNLIAPLIKKGSGVENYMWFRAMALEARDLWGDYTACGDKPSKPLIPKIEQLINQGQVVSATTSGAGSSGSSDGTDTNNMKDTAIVILAVCVGVALCGILFGSVAVLNLVKLTRQHGTGLSGASGKSSEESSTNLATAKPLDCASPDCVLVKLPATGEAKQ